MYTSPRNRRLQTDHKALERLKADSSILDFEVYGDPPDSYFVRFRGTGLYRPEGTDDVRTCEAHEVRIELGASYPRSMPRLTWMTPIFHPNISGSGMVCLGGYGSHWVPSLNLDELCEMLWDMIRYRNYDVTSPYNRAAAAWARQQGQYALPVDPRPIRDRLASDTANRPRDTIRPGAASTPAETDLPVFIDAQENPPDQPPSPDADIIFLD